MIRTYKYAAAAAALALALGGAPAAFVHAEDGADGSVSATAVVSARVGDDGMEVRASTTASTTMRERDRERLQEVLDMRAGKLASSTEDEDRGNATSTAVRERNLAAFAARFGLSLEATATPALSAEQLKQMIENKKHELEQEEASSSPEVRDVVANANQVRLAVHALLASKDLLGGVGSQVSAIAAQMNDSLATTTTAEAEIQSRGVLARIFLGGDKKAAEAIKEQVAQNKDQIEKLQEALSQASVSADVKAQISAQVTALQNEQARLDNLATSEASKWGLFSWLFH